MESANIQYSIFTKYDFWWNWLDCNWRATWHDAMPYKSSPCYTHFGEYVQKSLAKYISKSDTQFLSATVSFKNQLDRLAPVACRNAPPRTAHWRDTPWGGLPIIHQDKTKTRWLDDYNSTGYTRTACNLGQCWPTGEWRHLLAINHCQRT